MIDVRNLRIVEIGSRYVGTVFPEQTQSFVPHSLISGPGEVKPSFGGLPRLLRALRASDLSLIVCRPGYLDPWHWSRIVRALFGRRTWQGYPRFGPAIAPHLLRLPVTAPIAVIDTDDIPFINRTDLFLLSRCTLYFKRELPPDRWRLFTRTAHSGLPTTGFRRESQLQHLLDKLRPVSLGLLPGWADVAHISADKSADVFFAGTVEASSTIRKAGMAELLALRERGLRIDVPVGRLPPEEFYRRCANAWLTWSPEGRGWDCYRHYEALGCGSVPVINQTTIERHRPLLNGVHAIYYDPEPGALTRAIDNAIADKDRLQTIAREGKAHVLANHTRDAISRYVIESTLGAEIR